MQKAITSLAARKEVRVVVIAASGPAFCSGHNLKELSLMRKEPDGGRSSFNRLMTQCSTLMQSLIKCRKPVIAAVEGIATAAGCQLVATCDLAVASTSAQFCTPGVDIGLFCSTPMVGLTRNIPRKAAMEMLMLGEMISADEALANGLVNRVVEPGKALAEAVAMGQKIAAKSPLTIAYGKEAFYAQVEIPLQNAYDYAVQVMVTNLMTADAEEGIQAFLYKRAPHWEGN